MSYATFHYQEGLPTPTELMRQVVESVRRLGRIAENAMVSDRIVSNSSALALEGMTVVIKSSDDKSEGNGDDPAHDGKLFSEEDKDVGTKFEPKDPKDEEKN